jgi:hypothetical protein
MKYKRLIFIEVNPLIINIKWMKKINKNFNRNNMISF